MKKITFIAFALILTSSAVEFKLSRKFADNEACVLDRPTFAAVVGSRRKDVDADFGPAVIPAEDLTVLGAVVDATGFVDEVAVDKTWRRE